MSLFVMFISSIQFAVKLKSRKRCSKNSREISLLNLNDKWQTKNVSFQLNKNITPMATLCSGSSLQNGASLVSLGSAKNFPWKARRAPLHRWRNGGLYGGWQYIWRRRQRRRQPRNVSRSSSRILRPLASTIRSKMWCTLVASAFQAGRRGTSSMIIQ